MQADRTATLSSRSRADPRRLFRAIGGFARGVVSRSARDDITGVASQFAYNAFLATVPFLFIIISVIGLLASPDTFQQAVVDGDARFSDDLQRTIDSALRSATENTGQAALFLLLGLAGALYVSANVMGALIGGLDRARGVPHRSWLHGKAVAMAFAVVASLLVIVTTLAMVGGPRMVNALAERLGADPGVGQQLITPIGAGSLLVFTLLLYQLGPNAPRRRVLSEVPGAIAAAALWVGASRLFSLYIDNFDSYDRVYGALGALVVYLIFMFITGVVLLLGAEINAQLAAARWRRAERDFAEGI